jgi:hypothetical protein
VAKWQYMTAQFITAGLANESVASDTERAMNECGAQGWELVSSNIYHNVEAAQDVLLLLFKRPLAEVPPEAPAPEPGPG